MALIIEDGSIVANANSYVTVANFRLYAEARGVTDISEVDSDVEVLLIKAMDFLEGQHTKYQGCTTSSSQVLQWPRSGVMVDNLSVGVNEIPRALEYAQYALALEVHAGNDLQPTRLPSTKGVISKEKIGPIEIAYESSKTAGFTPGFAKAEALLSHLYKRNGLQLIRA